MRVFSLVMRMSREEKEVRTEEEEGPLLIFASLAEVDCDIWQLMAAH
jgi:hypothetical protein